MTPRAFLLIAAMAAAAMSAAWPAWRIHVRQKGDDLYLAWRHAPLWSEAGLSTEEMSAYASTKLGFAISPSDCRAMLDTQSAYLQLAGIVVLSSLGWLLLGEMRTGRHDT